MVWLCLNRVRPRRPEQSQTPQTASRSGLVSIESGLEGRNNPSTGPTLLGRPSGVSIESGLEGRNNLAAGAGKAMGEVSVSIESGLEGRNNTVFLAFRHSHGTPSQ